MSTVPKVTSNAPASPPAAPGAAPTAVPAKPKRYRVRSATGAEIEVQNQREAKFYSEALKKYLSENSFTIASDLRSLDRLLLFEVQAYRWQWQLAAGMDYYGQLLEPADEVKLARVLKETQSHISQIQNDLNLTLAKRSADHDSVGTYIAQLRVRAKAFGINREKQLDRALELMSEVLGIVGGYRRSNDRERRELGWDGPDDIIAWIDEVARPRFDEVDAHFRANEQRAWIREQ